MRKYEKRPQTIEEREELVETTCDLCGAIAKEGNWESSAWEVAESEIEIEVRYKDGCSYPEHGSGELFNVDICPKCFREKLIPWLRSQGCKTKFEEWDW